MLKATTLLSGGGSAAVLTKIPTWIDFDFVFSDFAIAGLGISIPLYSLPARGHITGGFLKHSTLFTGPGIASVEASCGIGNYGFAENDVNNGRFSLAAITSGIAFNTKTLEITDTVLAGAETVTWAANTLVIEVEAGVSTVAQVLAAVPVGVPWAILASAVAGTVDALGATAMSTLPAYIAGVDGNLERDISLFDVMQAPGNSVAQNVNVGDWYNEAVATALRIQLVSTGANLNVLTQGALRVSLLLSKRNP